MGGTKDLWLSQSYRINLMESNLYPANATLILLAFEIIENDPLNNKCER